MGSSQSSGLKYAEWEDYDECCTDNNSKMVEKIELYSVPLMSTGTRIGANIGRGFLDLITLGLAEVDFQGRRLSHDVILATIKCKKCNTYSYYTLEYTKDGAHFTCGEYQKYSPIDGSYFLYPINMNYNSLKDIYDYYYDNGTKYHIISYKFKPNE